MADLIFISITMAFFGLCALYIRGCERLVQATDDVSETPEEAAR